MIVSDALEMRAVSGPFGIAQAAVLAVAAGTDLLCFGRDQDEPTYVAVRDALVEAVRSGQLPASRLEESAARVADLRAWAAAARRQAGSTVRDGADVGLVAARRAMRLTGTPPLTEAALAEPVLVEVVPPSNIAVGTVPWGLSRWVRPGSVHRISTTPDRVGLELRAEARALLADASGLPLIVVVRDAHRYPVAQDLVRLVLAARPDAIIVEMGLPVWHPPAEVYLATFGATKVSSAAAAQVLGLTSEGKSSGSDRA